MARALDWERQAERSKLRLDRATAEGVYFEPDPGRDSRLPPRPKCPRCKTKYLHPMESRFGPFWGCSAFPSCHYTQFDEDVQQAIAREIARRATTAT